MFHSLFRSRSARFFFTILFLSSMTPAMADWRDTLKNIRQDIQREARGVVREMRGVETVTNKTTTSPRLNDMTSSSSSTQFKIGNISMFERMTVQFLLANGDKIQSEVAAALYGYAVEDYNAKENNECKQIEKINNSIDARSALKSLHTEMLAFIKTHPDKYKNHEYTISLNSSALSFKDYDQERSALIIHNWNSLSYTVDAQNNRSQRKFTPCKAMLDLPHKAKLPLTNSLPRTFRYDFKQILADLYTGPNKALKAIDFVSDKLKFVPMSSGKALTLLRRERLDKGLTVKVTFKFKPIGFKYMAKLDKNSILGFEYDTILKSISYIDKKTGAPIYRLGINNYSFTCESAYHVVGGLVQCPQTMAKVVAEKTTKQTPYLSNSNQTENTSVKALSISQLSDDAKKVYKECGQSIHAQFYFDCSCIAQNYEQELTSEEAYAKYITGGVEFRNRSNYGSYLNSMLYHTSHKNCVRPKKIAQYRYDECISGGTSGNPQVAAAIMAGLLKQGSKENVCSCIGNTTAKEFSENPILYGKKGSLFIKEASTACLSPYI